MDMLAVCSTYCVWALHGLVDVWVDFIWLGVVDGEEWVSYRVAIYVRLSLLELEPMLGTAAVHLVKA